MWVEFFAPQITRYLLLDAFGIEPEAGRKRTTEIIDKMKQLKHIVSNYHKYNNMREYFKPLIEFYNTDFNM